MAKRNFSGSLLKDLEQATSSNGFVYQGSAYTRPNLPRDILPSLYFRFDWKKFNQFNFYAQTTKRTLRIHE